MRADTERRPDRPWRQQVAQIDQRLRRRRGAIAHAQHDLEERRRGDHALADQLFGEPDIAGIKHFELGLHASMARQLGDLGDVLRRIDERAGTKPHGAEIEAAHVRLEINHVAGAHRGRAKLGARSGDRRILLAGNKHRAGSGRQVDDDVAAAVADAADHLAIKLKLHAGAAGLGVAHVDVHHGGAGLWRHRSIAARYQRASPAPPDCCR